MIKDSMLKSNPPSVRVNEGAPLKKAVRCKATYEITSTGHERTERGTPRKPSYPAGMSAKF